ncbi:MAG: calcium-binding protein [Bacteroidota bacterium]
MKNAEYDDKLYSEILVDCHDEDEQNMSWYYYCQDELEFPFEANIELKKRKGGTVVKQVNVLNLSTDDSDFDRSFDLKVEIELNEYVIGVPISQLTDIKATEATIETINIWNYWNKR